MLLSALLEESETLLKPFKEGFESYRTLIDPFKESFKGPYLLDPLSSPNRPLFKAPMVSGLGLDVCFCIGAVLGFGLCPSLAKGTLDLRVT